MNWIKKAFDRRVVFDPEEHDAHFWGRTTPSEIQELFYNPAYLGLPREDGRFPVQMAAQYSSASALSEILKAGANANQRSRDGAQLGVPPMFHAIHSGDISKVKILLEAGAEIEGAKLDGETPLIAALFDPPMKSGMIKLLIDFGANPNARDHNGYTPLLRSCRGRSDETIEITRLLLDAGADPNICIESDISPLDVAVDKSSPKTVRLLLQRGANPNAIHNGSPALHRLLYHMPEEYIRPFLEAGADPNMEDDQGRTALKRAIELERDDILDLLQNFATSAPATPARTAKERAAQKIIEKCKNGSGPEIDDHQITQLLNSLDMFEALALSTRIILRILPLSLHQLLGSEHQKAAIETAISSTVAVLSCAAVASNRNMQREVAIPHLQNAKRVSDSVDLEFYRTLSSAGLEKSLEEMDDLLEGSGSRNGDSSEDLMKAGKTGFERFKGLIKFTGAGQEAAHQLVHAFDRLERHASLMLDAESYLEDINLCVFDPAGSNVHERYTEDQISVAAVLSDAIRAARKSVKASEYSDPFYENIAADLAHEGFASLSECLLNRPIWGSACPEIVTSDMTSCEALFAKNPLLYDAISNIAEGRQLDLSKQRSVLKIVSDLAENMPKYDVHY